MVGFHEGRIAVDIRIAALANDQLGMGEVECRVQRGAVAALYAVVGPEFLLAVGQLDDVERLLARVAGRKRGVPGRVPVLGKDDVPE
ncbi:hypothetical protein D3C75_1184040 [compost metagenome]